MAVISHSNQFIYILNPRTASTATARALLAATDSATVPEKNILDEEGNILVPSKHTTINELVEHDLISRDVVGAYFKFVTVRNPFDSLVSSWAKKVKDYARLLDDPNSWVHKKPGYAEGLKRATGLSFSDWVRQEYGEKAKNGKSGAINRKFTQQTDKQLRFESLADDMAEIKSKLGVGDDFVVPELNVTSGREGKNYQSYYDDDAAEIIGIVFRDELAELGYTF